MNKLVLIVASILLFSCKSIHSVENRNAVTVTIDTLLQDKISIRALALDHDKVWYAADQSRFGFIDVKTNQKKEIKLPSEKNAEFRSIAQTEKYVFILNVGNPALLYKISKEDLNYELVYQENHEKVFYDSMQFWNDKEGIAIGDPIEGGFSVITTRDGGVSWQKTPSDRLPQPGPAGRLGAGRGQRFEDQPKPAVRPGPCQL